MTRETKIGLLVGLAFIIIVGILLSEPLSHSSEVQPAPLPGIAQNVRNAVTTPGAGSVTPPISIQPPNATPQQRVPTLEEVNRPHGGVVVIGPGGSALSPRTTTEAGNSATGASTLVGPRSGENIIRAEAPGTLENAAGDGHGYAANNAANNTAAGDPRLRAAKANGEELVPFGAHQANGNGVPRAADSDAGKRAKTYAAVTGDTVSKIASKFYGSNGKALRDAMINANPSLKQNPDRIIAGQTYTIPAVEATAAAAAPPPAQPAPQPPTARAGNVTAGTAPEYWYTVKENDNLWRIAKEQLGDAGAVAVLKELNKEVLKGSDTVRVNMKLRLPAKPLASAS